MKAILDRFDFVTTWFVIMLGVAVFITGFGFGAVADKTTPLPARFKPWPQTCIVFWFNGNQSNELSFKLQNIAEECRNLDQQISSPDMRATNVILREITHEPIVRRASNSWEITFKEQPVPSKWNGFVSPPVTNNQSTISDGRNYDWKEGGLVIGISDESLRTHHCIYIGEGATGTNNYELVITLTDGTEIRQMLPTNKTVNLPWMK